MCIPKGDEKTSSKILLTIKSLKTYGQMVINEIVRADFLNEEARNSFVQNAVDIV